MPSIGSPCSRANSAPRSRVPSPPATRISSQPSAAPGPPATVSTPSGRSRSTASAASSLIRIPAFSRPCTSPSTLRSAASRPVCAIRKTVRSSLMPAALSLRRPGRRRPGTAAPPSMTDRTSAEHPIGGLRRQPGPPPRGPAAVRPGASRGSTRHCPTAPAAGSR